jgi:hypothetical protein
MSPGIAVNGQDLLQAKSIQMVTIGVVKRISQICGNLQACKVQREGSLQALLQRLLLNNPSQKAIRFQISSDFWISSDLSSFRLKITKDLFSQKLDVI